MENVNYKKKKNQTNDMEIGNFNSVKESMNKIAFIPPPLPPKKKFHLLEHIHWSL